MNLSSAEAVRKIGEVFKQSLPSLARLAVLVHAPYPSSPQLLSEMEATAKPLNIHVHLLSISASGQHEAAFATATQAGAHAGRMSQNRTSWDFLRLRAKGFQRT